MVTCCWPKHPASNSCGRVVGPSSCFGLWCHPDYKARHAPPTHSPRPPAPTPALQYCLLYFADMRSPSATRSTDTSSSHSDATDESSPFGTQAGSPTSSFMTPVSTLSSRPSTPPPRSDVENDPYTPRSLASKETVNSMISSWRPSPMPTPGSFPGSPFNSPKKPGPSQSPTLGSPFHSPEKRVVDHKKVQQVYELLRYASDRQDSSEKLFKDRVESVLSETSTPPDDARSVKQSEHSRFIQERSERAQREWLEKTAATRSREDLPTDPPIQHCALPAWLPYLMAGITHQERSDKCRQINATNLVRRGLASRADGVWNGESMVALVEQFCWAASEEFSLTSGGTVAPFARAVSSEMRKSFGEERAQTFERFLQDSTMRMFSALWIIVSFQIIESFCVTDNISLRSTARTDSRDASSPYCTACLPRDGHRVLYWRSSECEATHRSTCTAMPCIFTRTSHLHRAHSRHPCDRRSRRCDDVGGQG